MSQAPAPTTVIRIDSDVYAWLADRSDREGKHIKRLMREAVLLYRAANAPDSEPIAPFTRAKREHPITQLETANT